MLTFILIAVTAIVLAGTGYLRVIGSVFSSLVLISLGLTIYAIVIGMMFMGRS